MVTSTPLSLDLRLSPFGWPLRVATTSPEPPAGNRPETCSSQKREAHRLGMVQGRSLAQLMWTVGVGVAWCIGVLSSARNVLAPSCLGDRRLPAPIAWSLSLAPLFMAAERSSSKARVLAAAVTLLLAAPHIFQAGQCFRVYHYTNQNG